MMNKTAYIRARVAPQLKIDVEKIFSELGITTSQVLNMLYKQISRAHKLPFELHLPNKETAKAIVEARKGVGVVRCKNAKDLFDELGI